MKRPPRADPEAKECSVYRTATVVFLSVCFCILAGGFLVQPDYPVRVICGERSVGTWLSGMLLVTLAVISMLLCMQKRLLPWLFFALFFVVLALDERFMFHEYCKERLLIAFRMKPPSWQLLGELPVIVGGGIGAAAAALLYKNIPLRSGKILLVTAVTCGAGSVVIDIFHCGVLWEEMLKLAAEMTLAGAFIGLIPDTGSSTKKVKMF